MVLHEMELPQALHREITARLRLVTLTGKLLILKGEEMGVTRLAVHLVYFRVLPRRGLLGIDRHHSHTGHRQKKLLNHTLVL